MTPEQNEWYNKFVTALDGLIEQYGCSQAIQSDADGNIFIADQEDNFYSDYGDVLLEYRAIMTTQETEEGQVVVLVDFEYDDGKYWFTDEIASLLVE